MPIYAYRCESCGRTKDVLQKLSDPILTVCPFCDKASFRKQVTAAGFQLKGSGWYVTDFRGGDKPPAPVADGQPSGAKADGGSDAKADGDKSAPAAAPAAAPADSAGKSEAAAPAAPAPAPPSSTAGKPD